jgi:hypothetical protein
MSNKIVAALRKAAEKSEQTPTQIVQGYMQALEEPVLRVLCAILQGNPDQHPALAVKIAFDVVEAFAEEKMRRGEALVEKICSEDLT